MCRWTTGKAYPVMTAGIQLLAMTVITAKTVSVTIAASVLHIVRYVTRQCVWAVVLNVQIAKSLSAGIVLQIVKNAMKHFVRIV